MHVDVAGVDDEEQTEMRDARSYTCGAVMVFERNDMARNSKQTRVQRERGEGVSW